MGKLRPGGHELFNLAHRTRKNNINNRTVIQELNIVVLQRHIFYCNDFVHFQMTLQLMFSTYPMIFFSPMRWVTKQSHSFYAPHFRNHCDPITYFETTLIQSVRNTLKVKLTSASAQLIKQWLKMIIYTLYVLMVNLVLCLTRSVRCKGWPDGSVALTSMNSQPHGESCNWAPFA